jgi:hypothetical protein
MFAIIGFVGLILFLLGLAKVVGIAIGIATAAASTLIVIGLILILAAWWFGPWRGTRTRV